MRRLAVFALALLAAWRAADACGPWYVLRAALSPVFWQPSAKNVRQLLGEPVPEREEAIFAGMSAGGSPTLAAARRAYQGVARSRLDDFEGWETDLEARLSSARHAVDAALAAPATPADAEELRLIRCKLALREGEALLVTSRHSSATPDTVARAAVRSALEGLSSYLAGARNPTLASEARGWLARCHYLLGDHHQAARIYLDELDRRDSALSRETLLLSLRLLFRRDGSDARLEDHLDEYFDTPRHALFVVNLVTNPVEGDENARRAREGVGRKALAALERHPHLFTKGADSDRLAMAVMRASLYMGDPLAVVKLESSIPADSRVRADPEARWMLAIANFLLGRYAEAEPHLRKVAASAAAPPEPRVRAQLGLLAVYQKLERPVDQLIAAFRYEAGGHARDRSRPVEDGDWSVGWWPYSGWLMDLPYLLDVQLTEDELRVAKAKLDRQPPLKVERWTAAGQRTVTASYLIDYELAVRAARRESYDDAAVRYEKLGARVRAARMRTLARLFRSAEEGQGLQADERRYAYGVFLADNTERVFFNDLVWNGYQRYGFLQTEADRDRTPPLLSARDVPALLENERAFRDGQEERWRAFRVLDDVVARQGRTELGRRAARRAIECLDRINTERFGRETQVVAARTRLVRWLHEAGSHGL